MKTIYDHKEFIGAGQFECGCCKRRFPMWYMNKGNNLMGGYYGDQGRRNHHGARANFNRHIRACEKHNNMMSTFHGYMKATVFAPKRAIYPAYVQPKHNGIRCLWDGETAWTREGKIHKPHIKALCKQRKWLKGWVMDGELVLPRHEFSFQQTQSAVTGKDGSDWPRLTYQVFDAYNTSHWLALPFSGRMDRGSSCATYPVQNLKEVEYWYDTFLEQGYEGLIFRTDTPYKFGSAARHLMKKKPVKHAEFICLAVWEGTGKNKGVPVYRLQRPDAPSHLAGDDVTSKNTFGAVPKGTYEEKRALWATRWDAVGKPYTIECADFYDSGVPQFPIGIGVRDYE